MPSHAERLFSPFSQHYARSMGSVVWAPLLFVVYGMAQIATVGNNIFLGFWSSLADAAKSAPPTATPPPAKQGRKDWVDVTDEDGNFVGRVSPQMADLAKKRGARERFSEARGDGDSASRVTVVGDGVEGGEAGSEGKWKMVLLVLRRRRA